MPGMVVPQRRGIAKSQSSPSLKGRAGKSPGPAGPGNRLGWAEIEIAKAQKALVITSEQIRADANQFLLKSVTTSAKENKASEEQAEAKEVYRQKLRRKKEDTIPDDFFVELMKDVEKQMDKSTPRVSSMARSPSAPSEARTTGRALTTPFLESGPSTPVMPSQSVEIRDFVVGSTGLDTTLRPGGTARARVAWDTDSVNEVRSEPDLTRSARTLRLDGASTTPRRGRTPEQDGARSTGGMGMDATLKTVTSSSLGGGEMLLTGNVDALLEDLKAAADYSKMETESLCPTTVMEEEEEVPFWERDLKGMTAEDDEKYELDQAIWRLRKYLRNRFGGAQKAWAILEGARKTENVSGEQDAVETRMADTLTMSEIKVAFSRLGIKLPFVTGYNKIKQLLNAIDKNQTNVLTYIELMGDEEKDRSLLADPPPPSKETWQTALRQPRWHMNWEVGYFDDDLLECIISGDVFRPTKEKFESDRKKMNPPGYKPVWQKYQQVMDEKRDAREELARRESVKEMAGCTFKPDMGRSNRSATRILNAKKKRRAVSQHGFQTVHERNMAEMIEQQSQLHVECTFTPPLCPRTNQIHNDLIATGIPFWERLTSKEPHDRFGHVAKVQKQVQDLFTFQPDDRESASFGIHHDRTVPVHERLHHHEKHEFWHGDARGNCPDDEEMKRSNEAVRKSLIPNLSHQAPDLFSQFDSASATASASSARARGRSAPVQNGHHHVPYRQNILGVMEACERWGTYVDDDALKVKLAASQRVVRNVRPPSSDSDVPTDLDLARDAKAKPQAKPEAKAKAKAGARAKTPVPPLKVPAPKSGSRSKSPSKEAKKR